MKTFFEELKKRRVYRVAIVYGLVASGAVQLAGTVLPAFNAPVWMQQVFLVALALGFPVALILAWAFDLTPAGIQRTPSGHGLHNVRTQQMWLLGGAETEESRPLVLVYFAGPPEWHKRHWESKFDGNVQENAPVTYKLASASVTLEIAVSADRKRFWVQGNEFPADQTNVFVVKNVNDPKQQRIEKVGHLTLPSNTAEPLSVVVLRDNPPLKSLLE